MSDPTTDVPLTDALTSVLTAAVGVGARPGLLSAVTDRSAHIIEPGTGHAVILVRPRPSFDDGPHAA